MDIHGPLQPRGETRCPGGVSVSCLTSRTRHECKATHRKCIYGGLTLDVDRHYKGRVTATTHQEKGIITLESEPLAGNFTTSFTRQREPVWQKCKIQKNWCTVTVVPTIDHHDGHSWTPANQRWDQVPGRNQRLLLGSPHPPWMPATQRKCIYGGLTLDVDRHYIGRVTATTHQEKGIITLESNPPPPQGTVLPAIQSYFPWYLSCFCANPADTYKYNQC